MRVLLVAAIVVVAALAGCSGKKGGDDEIHYTCPNGTIMHSDDFEGVIANFTEEQTKDFLKTKCPKSGGSGTGGSKTNSTTLGPNVLPVLKLNVTDDGGNATIVIMKGGNLTFDATGSFDPDGELSAIAISVKDSNQTRTKSLYDIGAKKFSAATFRFDRAGPINISIAMVDDRAGFTTNLSKVYVNEMVHVDGGTLHHPAPDADDLLTHPCKGAAGFAEASGGGVGGPIFDSNYFKSQTFSTNPGLWYIVATADTDTLITICAPDGTPVSEPRQEGVVTSTNTEPLPPPPSGTESYAIGMYAKGPETVAGATVVIHYEPKPAAPAA